MMKRLRLFLMMLAALLCPSAFAQESGFDYVLDETKPLITSVDQLSSTWSCNHDYEGNIEHLIDDDPMTYWHSDWGRNTGRHFVQVSLNEPTHELVSMKFTRRKFKYNSTDLCTADHVIKWGIYGAGEPDTEDSDWELLLEAETPYNAPGETMNTIGFDTKGLQYLRIYGEETNSGKRYWHCAEIQLYPCELASELQSAIKELTELYILYEPYLDTFKDNAGTIAGQYLPDAVSAFETTLLRANDIVNGSGTHTAAEVKEIINALKSTYQAVLDSVVPFTLADGYYRIRHALTFINDDQEVPKYMYSLATEDKIIARWGTPEDLNVDCTVLWKVTNQSGFFDIVNCATEARFDEWVSNPLTMSQGSTNLIAVELVENLGGDACVTMRCASQIDNNRAFFHPLNHGISASTLIGSGTDDVIIGWANDQYKVSEWVFEPVDEATAVAIIEAYGPYHEHAQLVENFIALRDEAAAKLEVAKDIHAKDPLITKVGQLSSPWNAPHEFEGNLAHLIDGDPLTYWHTNWNNNTDRHYVQVALNEPVHNLICMKFTRRLYQYNSTNPSVKDHVIAWSIWGSDDPTAAEEDWETLAEFDTPYTEPGETMVTDGFDTQGKKYLRIYGEDTNEGKKYWHVAELQLYPSPIVVVDSPTSQYHMMGSVGTALNDVLTPLLSIDPETITQSKYDALLAAFEAFDAVYVDPHPLRNKILEVEEGAEIVAYGTNPGFWAPDNQAIKQLSQAINEARAYDEGGQFTESQRDQHIANLEAKSEGIKEAANPILGGKWYRIRFGTEEEYNKYGWNKNGNETQFRTVNGETTETVVNESLFGKYLTIARLDAVTNEDEGGTFNCNVISPISKEDVSLEHNTYCDDLEDIENPDMALWRFIPVGDNEFYLQNKATGLYLQKKAENNNGLGVSLHPSIFSQEVAGYGQNALFIKTLHGEQQNPMHFARNMNSAITYGSWGDSDGRRGCFFIEEVEDVSTGYAQNTSNLAVWDGAMIARCYPISLQATNISQGIMYTVSSIERNDAEVEVTLKPMVNNSVPAARPFIYIKNGSYIAPEDRSEYDEPQLVAITFGTEIVKEPNNGGALKGVFTRTNVDSGVLLVGEETIDAADSSTAIDSDRAYIATEDSYSSSDEILISFDNNPEDGISGVLQKVARDGEIYTLDGRLVNRNGNLNSLRGAQPGVYIVNGVKVIIK